MCSLADIGRLLYEELGLCGNPPRTRTGLYATDADTLRSFVNLHPIFHLIVEYRELQTLLNTYLDKLPAEITEFGRIHTTFGNASTGRLTSRNPNLQNIPRRSVQGQEIRLAFLPRNDDYLLATADYSQFELRILASLSRDSTLSSAFEAGIDVHAAMAAQIFGVALDLVTAEMRCRAKTLNYGIAYGMSSTGLARKLGIDRSSATRFIGQFFGRFPSLLQFSSECVEFARANGYVESALGRRVHLPDINSRDRTARLSAERRAVNSRIQATAADMLKLAMIRIHRELTGRQLESRMLLQVHDELVLDVYRPEQEQVLLLVEESMRTAVELGVPVVVNLGVGKNWLEAHCA
jgi:DNA polymerase-1